jgi:hypothetical protein
MVLVDTFLSLIILSFLDSTVLYSTVYSVLMTTVNSFTKTGGNRILEGKRFYVRPS